MEAEGIFLDSSKIEAIRDWPTPKTVMELIFFLGLVGYNQCFISQFAQIAAPTQLLCWQSTQQNSKLSTSIQTSQVGDCNGKTKETRVPTRGWNTFCGGVAHLLLTDHLSERLQRQNKVDTSLNQRLKYILCRSDRPYINRIPTSHRHGGFSPWTINPYIDSEESFQPQLGNCFHSGIAWIFEVDCCTGEAAFPRNSKT